MKREKFLWPLTQSHHRALVLAKRVRERLAPEDSGSREDLLMESLKEIERVYDWELKRHFQDEEEMLVLFEARVGEGDPDAERIRQDHRLLESLMSQKNRESLLRFAETIAAHVRFEEDVLFGRIEKAFNEEEKRDAGEKLIQQPN